MRNPSNLSLDSGAHELAVGYSALGFGFWNLRSCCLLCLARWLAATKEEELKLLRQNWILVQPTKNDRQGTGKASIQGSMLDSAHNTFQDQSKKGSI